MSRVTCRCGETITVKSDEVAERVDCPKCGAKIRLRRRADEPAPEVTAGSSETDDGYIRFYCPCGRRLKVRASGGPRAGKCPECGRLVPVPGSGSSGGGGRAGGRADPDAKTADLDPKDVARLNEWTERHTGRPAADANGPDATPTGVPHIRVGPPPMGQDPVTSMVSFEAGLRVCPRCGKPVHISATSCRECGAAVPRR
jgi:predicted RNA-binding Zn-ribbon protein involved in translation (DUF1610 family)